MVGACSRAGGGQVEEMFGAASENTATSCCKRRMTTLNQAAWQGTACMHACIADFSSLQGTACTSQHMQRHRPRSSACAAGSLTLNTPWVRHVP
jgi:hypothetical protein